MATDPISMTRERVQTTTGRSPGLRVFRVALVLLVGTSMPSAWAADGELTATQRDLFESKVRPLLVQNCLKCHGEHKQQGGLRLDSRAGWQKGGDSGPPIVPGKPEESLLIEAVRYESLEMPPTGKLSDGDIAILEAWVRLGAPDPRDGTAAEKPKWDSLDEARRHWAFQPIANPEPPAVQNPEWPREDLDRFVLRKLEAEQMKPNSAADRRTLIRRAYFDLIGLLPSFEDVERFVHDPRADVFSHVVDELLARHEYGQRWGRHWLDVARYADKDEVSAAGVEYPFAYTYRDYVIEAFNADKPYDQFIVEQLAADKLQLASRRDLAALGFLTVGPRFDNVDNLIMDDRIDAVTRGFLALTVACARCHDHKFDAVPTADYYSLYGVFASTVEPMDLPEIGCFGDAEAIESHLAERAKLLGDYVAHVDQVQKDFDDHMRMMPVEYLQYVVQTLPNHRTIEGDVPMDTPRGLLRREGPARWLALIDETAGSFDPFFAPWHALAAFKRDDFAPRAAAFVGRLDELETQPGHGLLHPWIKSALHERMPQTMLEVAEVYGQVILRAVESQESEAATIVGQVYGTKSPVPATRAEIEEDLHRFEVHRRLIKKQESKDAAGLRGKLMELEQKSPVRRAMVVRDSPQPFEPQVFVRGNPDAPSTEVPRQFLTVLGHAVKDHAGPYVDGGRLELAQAIASRGNPLAARVIVNRVWQQHFGQGLVETADDFGVRADPPSHPELLDHLATWFMDHGWSLKALHRYVLQSATWQQASDDQPACRQRDPGNRWLWKMNRRRLEFEPLRDSLLAVAGRLDTRLDGPPQRFSDEFTRRAVYGLIDRKSFPTLLRSFDVATPEVSAARRVETTVPQQALFLMNNAWIEKQACALRQRAAAETDDTRRIERLYELAFARRPNATELTIGLSFVAGQGADTEERWISYAQLLLMSNEFAVID